MKRGGIGALAALALASSAVPAPAPAGVEGEDELSALINRELRVGGSWFTPAEQRVIEQKCGYKPGEWDGFEARLTNGEFHCTNGRVVGDPEMRALIRAAGPRIDKRVSTVMGRADVRAAISRVANAAAAEAMREIESGRSR